MANSPAYKYGPILIGLLMIILLSGFSAPTPTPILSDKIAFTRLSSERQSAIYIMNADGSNPVNLTEGASGINVAPAWSPDGQQIAFISNRDSNKHLELYVMNADGKGVQQLTHSASDNFAPAWSPDGGLIAFMSGFNANGEIHIIHPDGTQDQAIAEGQWPSWSPDSKRLLITVGADWNVMGLAIVNVDGSELTPLDIDVPNASESRWSPDGTRIVFVSSANDYAGGINEWNEELWLVNTDGSDLTQLTTLEGNDHWQPSWSPDGTTIVFTHDASAERSEIYTINADGSGVTNLSNHPGYDGFPAWQP